MDYRPIRLLRCAEESVLVVPRTKLSSASRAFDVATQILWNTLSLDIRNSNTMAIYRKLRKTYWYKKGQWTLIARHFAAHKIRLPSLPMYLSTYWRVTNAVYLLTSNDTLRRALVFHIFCRQVAFHLNSVCCIEMYDVLLVVVIAKRRHIWFLKCHRRLNRRYRRRHRHRHHHHHHHHHHIKA